MLFLITKFVVTCYSVQRMLIKWFLRTDHPNNQISLGSQIYTNLPPINQWWEWLKIKDLTECSHSSNKYLCNSYVPGTGIKLWVKTDMGFPGGSVVKKKKIHLTMQETQETWARSLGQEGPLEEETATHSSILARESHEQRSLAAYSPWGHKESDTTEWLNNKNRQSLPTRVLQASGEIDIEQIIT